ncbi:bifunctional protein-disulfide isomerase/oxidoreductase DsbC [Ursidibacter maritimus]|uniref:Thiol:disulfide interchange protein n=1 Tax=Ursidibacter maritimus TaxID=1331689 RepID=A0A949WNM5_9PAST|nr:bifunctional protein-disulfide isomerase/oxidoreductase DsbC [Ursidibacter maritimus]KAE9541389.1 protein-disulfide isomerase [Ursidibacter maritimus]MBV6523819.1 bifunctional protein-disulfide isomerase/oxidoreductase DsbC [Ursidibacter maritimus]MBV6526094.1 bifunctional protein-disulfide isomerase/oxidoreductase DsbC [Ursidibacter maritimus]MBV6527134.1 bifunctional protein-disulfide isomerase/oxidoreductase DsbC [Ursidibacter maritimus]MBV6529031.1 bifunctional protein-disulfide isomera
MIKKTAMVLATSLLATSALADNANLQKQLEKVGATNVKISDSALPGFKTATSDQGIVQISQDGRFIIQGKVFELKNGQVVDITNNALLAELNALSNEMIVYPAKNPKHTVTVFMDITCHYCHLLHSKVKEYNDLGITVRYLAFPRGGMETQTAKQMEAIWTEKDKAFALNEAEKGNLPKELKTPSIVKKHYQLGLKFGVNGTPNIVTETGELIPGFVEPKELAKMLSE